jgi:hypothetical protein
MSWVPFIGWFGFGILIGYLLLGLAKLMNKRDDEI